MMKVVINGEVKEFQQNNMSITQLLMLEDVQMPETVSVQLNEEFISQDSYAQTEIKDGDEVNFLYFMGGGCIKYA